MVISKYLSNELKFFSSILSLLVVILHAYKEEILLQETVYTRFFIINQFISIGIGQIVIPLFFVISGLLFFKDFESFSFNTYLHKIKKRFYTLFIPYIIVSALGILIAYIVSKSGLSDIFSYGRDFTDYSPYNLLKIWLLKPEAYHLWFIRNLMILCIFSPVLIYCLKRKNGSIYYIIAFVIWFLFSSILPLAIKSILFFSLGALISIKKLRFNPVKKKSTVIITTTLWFISICLSLFGKVQLPEAISDILVNTSILLGILSFYGLYNFINKKHIDRITHSSLAQYSFFIYLFHEPMLTFIIELCHYMKDTTLTNSITYIAAPITTIFCCTLIGSVLRKYAFPIYKTITGNR